MGDGEEGDGVACIAHNWVVEEASITCDEEVSTWVENLVFECFESFSKFYPKSWVFDGFFGGLKGCVADSLGVDAFLEGGIYAVKLVLLLVYVCKKRREGTYSNVIELKIVSTNC